MSESIMQILRDLPRSRKLYLRGFISEKNSSRFLNHFNRRCVGPKPLSISISSSGGSTNATLRIYEAIRNAKCPVYGIVRKEASSGALMILQACSFRLASEDAGFSLHPNYYSIPFRIFALMDLESHVEEYREKVRTLQPALNYEWENAILPIYEAVEKAGHSKEDFAKLLVTLPTLTASQALEWGLVDKVIRKL